MKKVFVTTVVAVTLFAKTNIDAQKPEPSIVGTWKLVAIEGMGRGTARGDRPYGIITYNGTKSHLGTAVIEIARST